MKINQLSSILVMWGIPTIKLGTSPTIELWISRTQIENNVARVNALLDAIITDLYISHISTNQTQTPVFDGR